MPFTPAHAVVALPFARTPLVPAAIAIGAMAPDVPLFFRVGPGYWVTQADGWWSLWGGRRASVRRRFGAVGVLVASILLGAVTHLVWDAFTHTDRWGTNLLPFLDERTGPFYNADIAHWISSIIGLGLIAIWGIRWLRRQDATPLELAIPTWVRVLVWFSLPASLLAGLGFAAASGLPSARMLLERGGTTGAAIFLLIVAVIAPLVAARAARNSARHARDAR